MSPQIKRNYILDLKKDLKTFKIKYISSPNSQYCNASVLLLSCFLKHVISIFKLFLLTQRLFSLDCYKCNKLWGDVWLS